MVRRDGGEVLRYGVSVKSEQMGIIGSKCDNDVVVRPRSVGIHKGVEGDVVDGLFQRSYVEH